jgi:hypothetical protein
MTGPAFIKGGGQRKPFGSNEYLRSTQDVKKESYTLAAATVPNETIDGVVQKMLLPGEVLAKITSGPDAGKVGPFMAGATDGRQTAANIVGINDTWAPWQTMEHDITVAATYEATVVQAWCFERDAAGARITLTNTTIDAMRGTKGLSIMAK